MRGERGVHELQQNVPFAARDGRLGAATAANESTANG